MTKNFPVISLSHLFFFLLGISVSILMVYMETSDLGSPVLSHMGIPLCGHRNNKSRGSLTKCPTPKPCSNTTPKPCSNTTPKPCSCATPKPCSCPTPKPCSCPTPKPCSCPTPKPCSCPTPKPCSCPTPKPCSYPTPKPCSPTRQKPCSCPMPTKSCSCPSPKPCSPSSPASSESKPKSSSTWDDAVKSKIKQIAAQLKDLYKALLANARTQQPPPYTVIEAALSIAQALDPPIKSTETPINESRDVCIEHFPGKAAFGYPYFVVGWIKRNCTNVKLLKDVVNILINVAENPERDESRLAVILKGINDTHPQLKVHIAASKDSKAAEAAKRNFTNVQVHLVDKGSTSGKIWNLLVSKASAPYVLIGRDLSHFSWLARIERQISMVSGVTHVSVAGGSFRNFSGHWQVGCYQSKLLNYVLEYKNGYYRSKNECMYCDHLIGPFVTKTEFLKTLKFDDSLTKELVFEDWFLRLKQDHHEIINCPDAMYFTAEDYEYGIRAKIVNKQTWLPLAKKWTLNRILLPGGVKHKYSCKDIGYKCKTGITSSIALPVCCWEQHTDALSFFHDFCKKHKLSYELDSGSVLNAVKLGHMLPWEIDGDLIIQTPQNMTFLVQASSRTTFRSAGFPLSGITVPKPKKYSGFCYLNTPDMNHEVWGFGNGSTAHNLPPDIRHIRTRALYGGKWFYVPYSPGLYARNRYGHEIYKHAQHWRFQGMKDSWQLYRPGKFKKCKDPKFHGCLDKLPADGSIPFSVR